MTRVKKIFALTIALALVFALCSPSSYAISQQQFAAWIGSALTALNIVTTSTSMAIADAARDVNDFIAAPARVIANQIVDVPYTTPIEAIDDYLEQSTLYIHDDKIEIDGKEYTDIWLSNEAAEKFRVNAYDIVTAWNIASQSNGTYVSGEGYQAGIPIFNVNGQLRSQTYVSSDQTANRIGDVIIKGIADGSSFRPRWQYYTDSSYAQGLPKKYPISWYLTSSNDWTSGAFYYTGNGSTEAHVNSGNVVNGHKNRSPFDIDWVASEVPVNNPLPSDEGLHMLVPSNPDDWSDQEVQQTINNINNYFELNPDLAPDVDIDLSGPGILDKIDDLFDIIKGIQTLVKGLNGTKDYEPPAPDPEPEPEPEPFPDPEPVPYPDPDPEPGTTLPDLDWTELFDVLKNIFQKIANIDVTSQTIANKLVEFRNRFEDWMKNIRDLLKGIKDDILNSDKEWFEDIVDAIKVPFLPWINAFKSGVGIWHYVVEWINYIHEPFVFFFNISQAISYHLVLPIYALIAGTIVIAIYRRFGR